jgi:hypothetical protein
MTKMKSAATGQADTSPKPMEHTAPPQRHVPSDGPDPMRLATADAVQPPTTPPNAPRVENAANSPTEVSSTSWP